MSTPEPLPPGIARERAQDAKRRLDEERAQLHYVARLVASEGPAWLDDLELCVRKADAAGEAWRLALNTWEAANAAERGERPAVQR